MRERLGKPAGSTIGEFQLLRRVNVHGRAGAMSTRTAVGKLEAGITHYFELSMTIKFF
jgi:hypothetical protein